MHEADEPLQMNEVVRDSVSIDTSSESLPHPLSLPLFMARETLLHVASTNYRMACPWPRNASQRSHRSRPPCARLSSTWILENIFVQDCAQTFLRSVIYKVIEQMRLDARYRACEAHHIIYSYIECNYNMSVLARDLQMLL